MNERRVFIALNLPGKARERVFSELSLLLPKEKFRIVAEENLHVTLCFLGQTGSERIEGIRRELRSLVGFGPFEIGLSGAGCFGNNVVWLGVKEGREKVQALYERICLLIGFRDNEFSAHATLARNRKAGSAEVSLAVEKLNSGGFEKKVEVASVELMESLLSAKGPEYRIIESFPL